jgi:hypothetical protein
MRLTRRAAQGGGHISSSMAAHMQQPMPPHAHMQQPMQHMQPPPTYHQQQAPAHAVPHTVPHTVPHDLHEPYPPPYHAQYQQNPPPLHHPPHVQHEQPPAYDARGPLSYDAHKTRAPLPPLLHQVLFLKSTLLSHVVCCRVNVRRPLYAAVALLDRCPTPAETAQATLLGSATI